MVVRITACAGTSVPTTPTPAASWRFYTVPGDPAKGPDGEASDSVMAMAAKTPTGQWWQYGGGGTAWDSLVYDPKLNLGLHRHR